MRVQADWLIEFAHSVLKAAGTDEEQAAKVAEILVWSDLIGRHTQGVWRLPTYCKRVRLKLIKCPCRPSFEDRGSAVCVIDGDNGFGFVISALAMERAIALAQGSGIGFVGVRNSNFFGAGAYYVNQAASTGMIGVATSNSVPHVAAFGGRAPVLGTNPFAFGAPRSDGRNVLLDMSTSGSAGSMILKAIERNEPLPEGVAIDGEGRPITDPSKVEQGALLPFGGAKGYGLAVMVEILSGVLTGAGIADGVKSMFKNFQEGGNNGHFFVAVDIGRLMPLSLWYERLDYLINALKASGAGDDEVRYPGESRWEAYADNVKNGIGLDAPTLKALTSLGKEYRIDAPWLRT